MAKWYNKGGFDDDASSFEDDGASKQTRKIKYFINFEGMTIQPGNIERIERQERANLDSLGGENDCLIFELVLYMREFPFILTFPFATEEARADADVLLQSQMIDNRIQIQ